MRTLAVILSVLALFSLDQVASSDPPAVGVKRPLKGKEPDSKKRCTEPQPPSQDLSANDKLTRRVDTLEEMFTRLRSVESDAFPALALEACEKAVKLVFEVGLEISTHHVKNEFSDDLPDHLEKTWVRLFDDDESFLLNATEYEYPQAHQDWFDKVSCGLWVATEYSKYCPNELFKEAFECLTVEEKVALLALLNELMLPYVLKSVLVGQNIPVPNSREFLARLTRFFQTQRLRGLTNEQLFTLSKWVLSRVMALKDGGHTNQDFEGLHKVSFEAMVDRLWQILPKERDEFVPFLRLDGGHVYLDGGILGRDLSTRERTQIKLLGSYQKLSLTTFIHKIKAFRKDQSRYQRLYNRRASGARLFVKMSNLLGGPLLAHSYDSSLTDLSYVSKLVALIQDRIQSLQPDNPSLDDLVALREAFQKDREALDAILRDISLVNRSQRM